MSQRNSSRRSFIALAALGALAACQDAPTAAPSMDIAPAKGGPPAVTNTPLVWVLGSTGGLQSDGGGDYTDGVCGVAAVINNISGTKDATANTGGSKCVRKMAISYPDGTSRTKQVHINLLALELTSIPVGTTESRRFNIGSGTYDNKDACAGIRFGSVAGSGPVDVYRASATEWQVTTPAGTMALCAKTGTLFANSVTFTVRVK